MPFPKSRGPSHRSAWTLRILGATLAWPNGRPSGHSVLLGSLFSFSIFVSFCGLQGMGGLHSNPGIVAVTGVALLPPPGCRSHLLLFVRPIRLFSSPRRDNPATLRLEDLVDLGPLFLFSGLALPFWVISVALPLLPARGGSKMGLFFYAILSLAFNCPGHRRSRLLFQIRPVADKSARLPLFRLASMTRKVKRS